MLLFRKIEEIKKNSPSMKVLYLNTDAIMIEIPTNIPLPFTISSRTGDWKHQIKNCKMITKFVALNPSCYHLTYIDFEDKLLQVNKISGFSLESAIAGDFDIGKFENLLYSAIHEKTFVEANSSDSVLSKLSVLIDIGYKEGALDGFVETVSQLDQFSIAISLTFFFLCTYIIIQMNIDKQPKTEHMTIIILM